MTPLTKKKILRSLFLGIGFLCILAALGLLVFNLRENRRSQVVADTITKQLEVQLPSTEEFRVPTDGEMETIEALGEQYIGILEVPSLSLRLPIAATYDFQGLTNHPSRYTGSYETDDLVLCAHNYLYHFGKFNQLEMGSDIYLTTVFGKKIHYVVSNKETLTPTSVEQMIENQRNSQSKADWDLTLFTCTVGGQARLAVRCDRVE